MAPPLSVRRYTWGPSRWGPAFVHHDRPSVRSIQLTKILNAVVNFVQQPLPPGSTTGAGGTWEQAGALNKGQQASAGLTLFSNFWSYLMPLVGMTRPPLGRESAFLSSSGISFSSNTVLTPRAQAVIWPTHTGEDIRQSTLRSWWQWSATSLSSSRRCRP